LAIVMEGAKEEDRQNGEGIIANWLLQIAN
jgi:hypothetical protein